jgi:hypothetical protein
VAVVGEPAQGSVDKGLRGAISTGLLDLPETPKPPQLAAHGGVWFESGVVKLHLGVEDDFRPARKAHPALVVDDLPALVARLLNGGLNPVADTALPGRYFVDDPFGNRLELLPLAR